MKSEAQRRISLTLPDSLLDEVDALAQTDKQSRSEFITFVMKQYMRERRRIELKSQMKKGYLEMGDINMDIAEASLLSDESALRKYEEFLSESEKCDSKTR